MRGRGPREQSRGGVGPWSPKWRSLRQRSRTWQNSHIEQRAVCEGRGAEQTLFRLRFDKNHDSYHPREMSLAGTRKTVYKLLTFMVITTRPGMKRPFRPQIRGTTLPETVVGLLLLVAFFASVF